MKPIYFLLFSILTLYACTDQQTELEGASHSLRFGVETVEDTKGSVITSQNIRSMSVFCAHTRTEKYSSSSTCNWMHNAQVTRTDENSEWIVQGDNVNKQWKDEGYHSFFAFAPHAPEGAVVSGSTVPGPPTLTYTVPADHTKQVDLLYSQTTPINCKQMYIGSRPVVFGFRHALAKITFEVARAADVDPSTYFAIDSISLQNIHSTGTLSFEMDPELKQVIGAEWGSVSETDNYTVVSDTIRGLKFLWTDYQMHPISVDNTGLFVLPQKIEDNAVMEISFWETIHGIYSPKRLLKLKLSELLSEFQFGKAYRFSIVLKEDKVTITAQITDWDDQPVDVAVPGTYLNVSNTNITAAYGSEVKIFYATDAHVDSVKATCDKGISFDLNKINKYISIPSTTALGDYTFTLTAGKLSRKIAIKVDYKDFIAEEGVAAPRIFVQGTGDDAKLMLTKKPTNYASLFQFGGITAWNYGDTSPQYSVNIANWNSSWTSTAAHTVENLRVGKGDPCRLVGYTQKQVKDMLEAGTVPDNKTWIMPVSNDPDFPLEPSNRPGGWTSFSENGVTVNGHYFINTTTLRSNFLPAAGVKYSGGSYGGKNSEGWYWTITRNGSGNGSGNENKKAIAIALYSGSITIANNFMADGMSVRCVRQNNQ